MGFRRKSDHQGVQSRGFRGHVPAWRELLPVRGVRTEEVLQVVGTEMGLDDAALRVESLKLAFHEAGGHFASHCDTEAARTPSLTA